jgi:uncharacterized protein (DUF427 family)
MKLPGPDHALSFSHTPLRVRALYEGHVIADSDGAVQLKETGYKPVWYFPREHVATAFLAPTARRTFCPYKGEARYFSVLMDGHLGESVVWSYEDPYPAAESLRGLLAFYPNQIEIHELDLGEARDDIAEVILHTDSGAGGSQRERWPANVTGPLA